MKKELPWNFFKRLLCAPFREKYSVGVSFWKQPCEGGILTSILEVRSLRLTGERSVGLWKDLAEADMEPSPQTPAPHILHFSILQ